MNQEEATILTERCFNGEPASCSFACPFHMDLRNFLDKAANGKWSAAYKALRSAVFFPVVVSKLCPRPCQGACQRCATGDEPVAIGMIEEACLNYVKSRKADSYALPPKSEKIAVVGAGMAGLSCALHLAQKKFGVVVYDKAEGWGGQLRSHSDFELFDADIALQFSATKDYTPADVGYIIDKTVNTEDVASLIIYWAEKGYLTIIEDGKKTYLQKTSKELKGKLYEKSLFNAIFSGKTTEDKVDIKKIGLSISETVGTTKKIYCY